MVASKGGPQARSLPGGIVTALARGNNLERARKRLPVPQARLNVPVPSFVSDLGACPHPDFCAGSVADASSSPPRFRPLTRERSRLPYRERSIKRRRRRDCHLLTFKIPEIRRAYSTPDIRFPYVKGTGQEALLGGAKSRSSTRKGYTLMISVGPRRVRVVAVRV